MSLPGFIRLVCTTVLICSASVFATDVLYNIRPVINGQPITDPLPEVVVAPGDTVAYQVTALVTSAPVDPDNPIDRNPAGDDNEGLSFFRFDILTDLGVEQQPVVAFPTEIANAFVLLPNLGQVFDDDITQISGAQDTLTLTGTLTSGVGQGSEAVLAVGDLITGELPEGQTTASFTIEIGPSFQASVFRANTLFQTTSASASVGQGFRIVVTTETDDGDDTDTTTDVLYNIRPTINGQVITGDPPEITVAPGDTVSYQVTVLVTSASSGTTGENNNGLSSFQFDILTDLGVEQEPPAAFVPTVVDAFVLQQSLGQTVGDDILQIQGTQDTINQTGTLTPDIGQETETILAVGYLLAGELETGESTASFTAQIDLDAQASVFEADSLTQTRTADTSVGQGFTIIVTADTGDTVLPALPGSPTPVLAGTVSIIAVAAVTIGVMMLAGPFAGAIALILSVATLLLLVVGAATQTGV